MKENMNVGILTLPPISNYGGIIQNYALHQALKKIGVYPITINRTRDKISETHYFLARVKYFILTKILNKKYIHFSKNDKKYIFREPQNFVKKYIEISRKLENDLELNDYFKDKNYFAIIVGSDQVWRPDYTQNIYNYFFDFLEDNRKIRKIAYAASFGKSEWIFDNEQTKKCRQLIQNFDQVSVREDDGVKLCREHLHYSAKHVLDPTMLLNREEYLSNIDFSDVNERKGIFTYFIDKNHNKEKLTNKVSENLNLPVFTNQPKSFLGDKSILIEDYYTPSLEGWLKAFDQADFILTDSFHGTVFSIIFNKPFIAVSNKSKGASRFISLLKMFNLEDRLIDEQDIDMSRISELVSKQIDYKFVNKQKESYQEFSFNFLRNALK